MMSNRQSGRSMIEMLGVLAIIGVLSVGGLDMISKARRNNQINSLISGISKLSATIVQNRKYFSEVKSSYGKDYALFLKQTGKFSDDLSQLGGTITAKIDNNDIVVVSAANLDRETCLKVATNDWGTRRTSKFVGVIIGNSPDFSCINTSNSCTLNDNTAGSGVYGNYPTPMIKAATACSSATTNTVNLGYKL